MFVISNITHLIQILKNTINTKMTISDNENMAFQDLSLSHGMKQIEL